MRQAHSSTDLRGQRSPTTAATAASAASEAGIVACEGVRGPVPEPARHRAVLVGVDGPTGEVGIPPPRLARGVDPERLRVVRRATVAMRRSSRVPGDAVAGSISLVCRDPDKGADRDHEDEHAAGHELLELEHFFLSTRLQPLKPR